MSPNSGARQPASLVRGPGGGVPLRRHCSMRVGIRAVCPVAPPQLPGFRHYPAEQEGITALINIGHEVTNVNVVQDGVPLLTRDLSIGTRKFREDLQRERGLPAEDAERMLQGYERTPELEACVHSRGDEIAVGVERAAAFLQTSSRDARIRRVFCSGGGSRVPGLADVMADRLRIPVELANPLQGLEVSSGAFEGLNMDEVAPLLMQVIGLALRRERE